MKKNILLFALLVLTSALNAQDLDLIPYPYQVTRLNSSLLIKQGDKFYTNSTGFKNAVNYLNSELGTEGKAARQIYIAIDSHTGKPGAYTLSTATGKISIKATNRTGVFNGIITLLQLCRSAKTEHNNLIIPGLNIADHPQYQWRGFMLDESRHFFGKAAVKKILNWMAFYKLNRFHWHLTDAQGWRLQIKKYPRLTTIGGAGNFTDTTAAARYYTQNDIKEIVAFAKRRNIEVVPEIDMPGHATAANHAYPIYSGGSVPGFEDFTFNPGKEETYQFIGNVLKEVKALFPSGRIHIGGDEVTLGIKAWQTNTDVKQLMAREGFTDYKTAESYFLKRVADSVLKLNYKVMCWDEAVAAGLPTSNVIINWWRQNKPEALTQALAKGYKVILSPRLPMYFDFVQDSTHRSGRKWDGLYNSYLDIYHFPENGLADSVYKNTNVIGVQANLWTETVASQKRLDYLMFPRLAALAEAAWNPAVAKNEALFNIGLKAHLQYYKAAGIYYYNPFNAAQHPEAVDLEPKRDIKD